MRIERTFDLLVTAGDAWKIVPRGFSVSAMVLGPFWALKHEQLGRYLGLIIPIPVLVLVAVITEHIGVITILLYIVGSLFIYFPLKANHWRTKKLQDRGYKIVFTTKAMTMDSVLEQYAETLPGT